MDSDKEIRFLLIEVHPPATDGRTTEVRRVDVRVLFSDGRWGDLVTHSSMKPWPSNDLLETAKQFVAALERG